MKIFISHSKKDNDLYSMVANMLIKHGYNVIDSVSIGMGEKWIDKVKQELNSSDCLIALITENYLNSSWNSTELGYAVLNMKIHVLPVLLNNVFMPNVLMGYKYVKIDTTDDIVPKILKEIEKLNLSVSKDNIPEKEKKIVELSEQSDTNKKISLLHNALINNQLTLVCGAGVSKDSRILLWDELICSIITDVYFDKTKNSEFIKELLKSLPNSNIVLGKYLKLIIKDDFEDMLRKHLYQNIMKNDTSPYKTDMMNAISKLARPDRLGRRLESIITFNFDDIIEKALLINDIDNCAIWDEKQEPMVHELPIYHVHGYLPQNEPSKHYKQDQPVDNSNLVFSEETYHSQFINPYSWSNMIQSSAYLSKVCLFVGLSLSDPNLRRLLDISWRQNHKRKHYIIKCKPKKDDVSEVTTWLFEQDANTLGLNVIWCSDFSEIPQILRKIVEPDV